MKRHLYYPYICFHKDLFFVYILHACSQFVQLQNDSVYNTFINWMNDIKKAKNIPYAHCL